VSGIVAQLGPLGVFLLMVPESACLPVPSELTLMSAGFGVHQGWFGFPAAVLAATAGNLAGSLIAYWAGRRGLLRRLPRDGGAIVDRCGQLFERWGDGTVLIARLLPLARSFVSLPAGHLRVGLGRFVLLTVAGCALWAAGFILAGALAGSAWHAAAGWAGRASLVLGALLALACARQLRSS
jgi:membrane protein DedA with SNARE-associated domain